MSKSQLFCFTYAGGNASFFDEIEKDLSDINVVKLEYSGHGSRHKEPLYQSFVELADELYEQVKSKLSDSEYALFGYSMGTISLVEVLTRIVDKCEIPLPSHVFLAAHEPITKVEFTGYSSDNLDEWVKNRTIKFGAIPDKLMNNTSFWRMYLPLYRADYSLIGKYKFEELNLKCDIPATIFYSETDTPKSGMELWTKYFKGKCDFYQYEGSHLFIRKHHSKMAKVILGAFR